MNLPKTNVKSMPLKIVPQARIKKKRLSEMEIYLLEEQEDKLARMQDELETIVQEISMVNRINVNKFYNYRKVV